MKKLLIAFCLFAPLTTQSQDQRRVFVDSLLQGVEVKKDIRYNTTGRPLLLDIYYPQRTKGEKLPCVVWIHGGALIDTTIQKDYDLVRWGIARTTKNGYISVSIDYRLVTESPLPTAIQDCETAIRYLKSHDGEYKIDTNRIAVVGESAGGYLAGFCSFACNTNTFSTYEWNQVSNNIACGVLWYPAINHTPYNMLDYISPGGIPVISIHGDKDALVPIDQSYQIQGKCKEKGIDFQLHVIKDAQHGFFDENWSFNRMNRKYMEQAIEITINFLDRQLR
jgi:acetyl esterase/lipase